MSKEACDWGLESRVPAWGAGGYLTAFRMAQSQRMRASSRVG